MATVTTAARARRVGRASLPGQLLHEAHELPSELPPALSQPPEELHSLVLQYVNNMREGQEIRSALCTGMTRCGARRWTVDNVAASWPQALLGA